MVGGVSVNCMLWVKLVEMMKKCCGEVFYVCLEFCIDNGVMIVYVGMVWFKVGVMVDFGVSVCLCWLLVELLVV